MKLLDHLRRHSLRDLFVYAAFLAKCKLDQKISSFMFILKCILTGVRIKSGAKVWGKVYINRFPSSNVSIGSNVTIISRPYLYGLNNYSQSKIRTFHSSACVEIGDNVSFNSICILARSKLVSIGNSTMIGGNCQIMDSDSHPVWPPELRGSYSGDEYDEPVSIGSNVFIGLNVIILKGTIIGNNSVIAAGSVVRGAIPSNCLAAGVPAKVIKRFANDARVHDLVTRELDI